MVRQAKETLDHAVEFAKSSPEPDVNDIYEDVYA